jgi:hypothetical protein
VADAVATSAELAQHEQAVAELPKVSA